MSNSGSPIYSIESIKNMLSSSETFIDKSAKIVNKYLYGPMPNSQASHELDVFPIRELVVDVLARASLCFESAADHLIAYICTLKEPAKTLSPYTCIRSLMESSALALWLFDTNIDVRARVGRCFGYRYKEFTEQLKFLESDKLNSSDSQNQINNMNLRIVEIENKAISLGYPQLSKNGKITGIATHMPEIVRLIRLTLNSESEYRMLSGVAHCYLWATRQVGFQIVEVMDDRRQIIKALEKHAHPEMIVFGINLAIPTFAKVFWEMGKLLGWDIQEISELLDQTFNSIGFNMNQRFWNQST
jgi:hypothetical protein